VTDEESVEMRELEEAGQLLFQRYSDGGCTNTMVCRQYMGVMDRFFALRMKGVRPATKDKEKYRLW